MRLDQAAIFLGLVALFRIYRGIAASADPILDLTILIMAEIIIPRVNNVKRYAAGNPQRVGGKARLSSYRRQLDLMIKMRS